MQAYLSVAPYVAAFPEYFEPLAWHLLRSKLRHWEKGLRELAAQALAGGRASGPAGWVVPLRWSMLQHRGRRLVMCLPELMPTLSFVFACLLCPWCSPGAAPPRFLPGLCAALPAAAVHRRGAGGAARRRGGAGRAPASPQVRLLVERLGGVWCMVCIRLSTGISSPPTGA